MLLLPSAQEYRFSFLHTLVLCLMTVRVSSAHSMSCKKNRILRTLCAYQHGMYHIGEGSSNLKQRVTFLSQPDTSFNSEPFTFNNAIWLFTHQSGILDNGIFFHSPCTSRMKGNLTFSRYASALIFRNPILGNCPLAILTCSHGDVLGLWKRLPPPLNWHTQSCDFPFTLSSAPPPPSQQWMDSYSSIGGIFFRSFFGELRPPFSSSFRHY